MRLCVTAIIGRRGAAPVGSGCLSGRYMIVPAGLYCIPISSRCSAIWCAENSSEGGRLIYSRNTGPTKAHPNNLYMCMYMCMYMVCACACRIVDAIPDYHAHLVLELLRLRTARPSPSSIYNHPGLVAPQVGPTGGTGSPSPSAIKAAESRDMATGFGAPSAALAATRRHAV